MESVAEILNGFEARMGEPTAPARPAVVAWAVWFDILREQVAKAEGRHPLQWADVLAD